MSTAKEYIKVELDKRFDLINCESFRKAAAEFAKKSGVTAKEWNENRAEILLFLSNKAVGMGFNATDGTINHNA